MLFGRQANGEKTVPILLHGLPPIQNVLHYFGYASNTYRVSETNGLYPKRKSGVPHMADSETQDRIEQVREAFGYGSSLQNLREKLCDGEPASGYDAPTDSAGQYFISYEAVRQYHNEGRQPPVHYLARLAEVFGVRVEWLVSGSGAMTKTLEGMDRLARQTNFELIQDIASGPSIAGDVALLPHIRTSLVETVKRKLELETAVRGDDVPRKDIIRWVHELAEYVIDPSKHLSSWDLPGPGDIGTGWAPAAANTLLGVRLRLSEDYWRARVKEARRQRKENPPEEPELTETERLIIDHAEELSAEKPEAD